MRRSALILFALPIAAVAGDPFECVDPDVADAFLGYWHESRPEYSTSVPADSLNLSLPPMFELVGSKRGDYGITVVYKSRTDPQASFSSSITAMEDAGWKDFSRVYTRMRGGFQAESKPKSATMCHDDSPKRIDISVKEISGTTLVSFYSDRRIQIQSQSCSELMSESMVRDRIPLKAQLPKLKIPADAKLSRNSSGGGGDGYSAYIVVATTMSRDELLRHFDDQIRDQLWIADTSWSGKSTLGSIWSKTGTKNDALVGELRIAEASTGVFNVRFTVSSVHPDNYYGGHSTTIGTN